MIVYFSKMYQAIPALQELYKKTGGVIITTRLSTLLKVKRNFPATDIRLVKEYFPDWWPTKKLMRQADVIVTGSPNKNFLSQFAAKKIMIFHGTYAYAGQEELNTLKHFDYLFSIGPRMTNYLAQGGYKDKVIESGYFPFLSFKSFDSKQKKEMYRSLNLSPSNKTILYMPMDNPLGSWDVMVEKLLKETPKEYNLILRPHPSMAVKMNIGRQLELRRIKSLCKNRGNTVLDLTDHTLSSIFNITDLIICDGASSPEESLFYKIPIMFVESEITSKNKVTETLNKKGFQQAYIKKLLSIYGCGVCTSPNDNIEEKIKQAFDGDKQKLRKQEEYFEWVFKDRKEQRQKDAISFISNLN